MEAPLFKSKSISSYNHLGNAKRNNNHILNPSNFHGGILHAPPISLSYSYPPPPSLFPQQNQPPLLPLPLPIAKPSNNNPRNRGISCPPVNRKINNTKPNKSKATKQALKASSGRLVVVAPGKQAGPDPNNSLPEDVCGVFALSPPPSSLPLPTFSLRPKLGGCNAEAAGAGVDAGATDNLRRLLRLR